MSDVVLHLNNIRPGAYQHEHTVLWQRILGQSSALVVADGPKPYRGWGRWIELVCTGVLSSSVFTMWPKSQILHSKLAPRSMFRAASVCQFCSERHITYPSHRGQSESFPKTPCQTRCLLPFAQVEWRLTFDLRQISWSKHMPPVFV